jgi:hypothetical protein
MRLAGIAIAIAIALSSSLGAKAESAKLVGRVIAGRPVVAATANKTRSAPVKPAQRAENDGMLIASQSQLFLREQLDSEKGRHQKIGQDSADDAMRLAVEETTKISDQAEDDIAEVRAMARGYSQQAMIAEITQESRRRQLAVRCNRQAEAKQRLSLAETRAQALDQTAQTLADEMAKVRKPGGFGLSPIGSNLYVRSYNHAESPGR